MKKYYSFETMFKSLRDALRGFLHDNNIYYEVSDACPYYHFEILVDSTGLKKVNAFLDSQTIMEV